MDKKQLSKIGIISVLVFLFGWLVTNMLLSFTTVTANTKTSELIKNLNYEKSLVEIRISELKPLVKELEDKRTLRSELEEKINNAINQVFQAE